MEDQQMWIRNLNKPTAVMIFRLISPLNKAHSDTVSGIQETLKLVGGKKMEFQKLEHFWRQNLVIFLFAYT